MSDGFMSIRAENRSIPVPGKSISLGLARNKVVLGLFVCLTLPKRCSMYLNVWSWHWCHTFPYPLNPCSPLPLRCLALWRRPKRNTASKTTVWARYHWSRFSSVLPSSSTAQRARGSERSEESVRPSIIHFCGCVGPAYLDLPRLHSSCCTQAGAERG